MWTKSLLGLLFLTACFKPDSEFQVKDGRLYVRPLPITVIDATPQKWLVGRLRRDKVTRSLFAKLALPKMSEDLLAKLSQEKVNSILVKVQRQTNSRMTTMGYIYVPLFKPARGGARPKPTDPSYVYVSLSYAAASISERLSRQKCPAFGHKKKLVSWKLKDTPRYRSEVIIIDKGELGARAGKILSNPIALMEVILC